MQPRTVPLAPLVRRRFVPGASGVALALALAACGSGGGSGGDEQLPPDAFGTKPDGSLYVRDPLLQPGGSRLGLVDVAWGRLVDVHDLDAAGEVEAEPLFRDLLVRPDLESDGVDYRLEVDPVTQAARLVVLRDHDGAQADAFRELVLAAAGDLPTLEPKAADGSDAGPFSLVPNNAALVLRFDDLLDDDAAAAAALDRLVQVRVGYPPTGPFTARVRFEPNYGGVEGGAFHSSRVVVDPAVSDLEALGSGLPANAFGLPASELAVAAPNVALRVPTRIDPGVGQFDVLTNLRGRPLATSGNGPVDLQDPTQPVVRALRAGNEDDPDRGFLPDDTPPRLLGEWAATVDAARADGDPALLVVDLTFTSSCRRAPRRGDVLETAAGPLQVRADAPAPDAAGRVPDVPVRALVAVQPGATLGAAGYVTPYDDDVEPGCWVRFLPAAADPPVEGVQPDAVALLRFGEPVDPRVLAGLDGPALVRGDDDPDATSLAPRLARLDGGLRELSLVPLVPLPHEEGTAEAWRVVVGDADRAVVDLSGNALAAAPGAVPFSLDPAAASIDAGGVVLRLRARDEYTGGGANEGATDLRGQVTYDLDRGVVRPRPVQRQSWAVDQTQLLPSLMLPLPVGVQAPLVPLGSRLQTLWRYADVGWLVTDESLVDLDVEGLSWAPFGGNVVADHFDGFGMRLGHSSRLPDETLTMGILAYPSSGLLGAPNEFDANLVPGRDGEPSEVVHPSPLGYTVDPTEVYVGSSGTRFVPYPLNRGAGEERLFTWRDTSVLAKGGANGPGIPLQVETDNGVYPPGVTPGSVAGPGEVPSIGLPLLLEFRTKPDSNALGLNGLQVAVARAGQLFPTWRVHTSGGYDVSGNAVARDPDLQLVPSGGFNPSSTPPGQRTRANDPTLYFGELQTVVRVSRAHTVWFDGGGTDVEWGTPLVLPGVEDQPGEARVTLQFRGATGFVGTDGAEADAARLDVYGDVDQGQVLFTGGDGTWKDSIHELDGAQFVQVRVTFENDVEAGVSPTLDALVLPFTR